MNHYEIEACVIRAKNGNKEELLKLMEQFRPFIFKTARDFNIKNYDMYDLAQIGYVALINAAAKYRTGSNTFSSYAYNSIKNAFIYTSRQNAKYTSELSLNKTLNSEEDSDTEFIESIEGLENVEEDIISAENMSELKRAVSKLPSEEMELVIMVYYSGISLKTYADKKGISYQRANRKRNKILEKLRGYIKK